MQPIVQFDMKWVMQRVVCLKICLPPDVLKELDAMAQARGVKRSTEIRLLVQERGKGEDPRVTAARYLAEAKEHERLGREARARASIERTRYGHMTANQRSQERIAIARLKHLPFTPVRPDDEPLQEATVAPR